MKLNKLIALLFLSFPIAFGSCQKSEWDGVEKNSVDGTCFLEDGVKVHFQDNCYIYKDYKDTEGSLELSILGGETSTGHHYCLSLFFPKGTFSEANKKLTFTDNCKVLVSFRLIGGSIFVQSEHQATAQISSTVSCVGVENLFKYGNILSGSLDIKLSLDNGDKIYLSCSSFTIGIANEQFGDPGDGSKKYK